jgi:hypothetical protein
MTARKLPVTGDACIGRESQWTGLTGFTHSSIEKVHY